MQAVTAMVVLPIVAITAKIVYAIPDCDGSVPASGSLCVTSQACNQKYKKVAECTALSVGLYNEQMLSMTAYYETAQDPKTTRAETQTLPCAEQWHCQVVYDPDFECRKGTQVLDGKGNPVKTYVNAWVAVDCVIPGGGGG
jgi:hypothetical protein